MLPKFLSMKEKIERINELKKEMQLKESGFVQENLPLKILSSGLGLEKQKSS
jgi:hypothetical protein